MRLTVKRGVTRYAVLVVGLGAAGVVIGWLCHDRPLLVTQSVRVRVRGLAERTGRPGPARVASAR